MVNSPTGNVASYKDSLAYPIDGQKAIVITTKNLQKGDTLRGGNSTVIRRDILESIRKVFSRDEKFDLMYKKNCLTSLSPEIRAVEIAQRNVELEQYELKKMDADIQYKRNILDRLSEEIKIIREFSDVILRNPIPLKSRQNEYNRNFNEKKDEYSAAENRLNIEIENRNNKKKRVTEAVNNLKIAKDNLANAKIKTIEKPSIKFHENLKKKYGNNNALLAQEFANKYKGKVIEKINPATK